MLRDPKSFALVENFAGQWLQFRNIDVVRPDLERFPIFDDGLRQAMRRETGLFIQNIIRDDRSVLDLLDADYTFVNERLARFYGIPGVTGPEFRRVDMSRTERGGGILAHASRPHGLLVFHPHLAGPARQMDSGESAERSASAPAARRAAARRQQGGRSRDAAAADGGASQGSGLRVAAIRGWTRSASAWRISMPSAPGGRRTASSRVDASGALPDGRTFQTPAQLKAILKADRDVFVRAMTEKLLIYALGRGLERYDRPAVNDDRRQTACAGLPIFADGSRNREQPAVPDEERSPEPGEAASAMGDRSK